MIGEPRVKRLQLKIDGIEKVDKNKAQAIHFRQSKMQHKNRQNQINAEWTNSEDMPRLIRTCESNYSWISPSVSSPEMQPSRENQSDGMRKMFTCTYVH